MKRITLPLMAGLAISLAAPAPAPAEITVRKLERLDKLVSANDCKGLFTFLRRNRELTRGNDPLAIELAQFLKDGEQGNLNCIALARGGSTGDIVRSVSAATAQEVARISTQEDETNNPASTPESNAAIPATTLGTSDPGPSDPGTSDPGPSGPSPSDPGPSDPSPSDPGPSDPGTSDPGTSDPGPSDPGPSDPGPSDPGPSDPGPSDPGPSDPGPSDPGPSDPGPSDPGPSDPGPTP